MPGRDSHWLLMADEVEFSGPSGAKASLAQE